ncbi:MAG: class I SAM-dependent methyltransferase [Dehalococcoidia bacterium]|jgi:SAM-dependent methyltransferase|nr:class I SAM-dependent methyltransferase [Dehalococcoidia bacterium]
MSSPETPDWHGTEDRPNNFGPVAENYEKHHSQYPSGLGADILQAASLPPRASLLEVGSGTGRATRLFTGQGFDITCIEPIEEMAAIAREIIGNDQGVNYVRSTFEDWSQPADKYDLVFSGQAFLWVEPDIGYKKLADVLRPGGTAALFWYTPAMVDPELRDQVDRIYTELAPEIGGHMYQPSRFDDALEHLERTATLGSIEKREYVDTRIDSTQDWLAMLGTTSDHLALPDKRRDALLHAIGDAIDQIGGVEVKVATRLWLATRV